MFFKFIYYTPSQQLTPPPAKLSGTYINKLLFFCFFYSIFKFFLNKKI